MSQPTRRKFLEDSLLAAAAAAAVPLIPGTSFGRALRKVSRNEILRVGVIGVRGRGRAHVQEWGNSPDAEVAAICDPDSGVIDMAMRAAPKAKYVKDLRELLDDDSIDAVSIATPNHWHSLAAIWALQAGKHVYVEKPLSHDVNEGRQLVRAAAASGKVLQHGTQARSTGGTVDAMEWLRGGGLGKVRLARALCYKRRESIGKVDGPQTPPATLDYDLWTGPADLEPLMRKELHYDWHWVYNTGNGDIGNQGVHQMDIARWGLAREDWPLRVTSCGGRLGYDDDGNTANTQIAVYEYDGDQKIIFEVRGLKTGDYKGAHIGVVFHCEQGYLVSSSYTKVTAFDLQGNPVQTFEGGGNHFQNFLDAIKAGDPSKVNADARTGHLSAALGHLGNVSYKLGTPKGLDSAVGPFADDADASDSFTRMREHLVENGLDVAVTQYAMGPTLAFDGEHERFTGDGADVANAMLKREGRGAFKIPELKEAPAGTH